MRLPGYDYSRAGLYFLTIVVQNRLHLFGKIERAVHIDPTKMILNDAGNMVKKWYYEIENKFPDKRCREMVVMPNHFHCIIENMETDDTLLDAHTSWDAHVGAPLRGRPENGGWRPDNGGRRPDNDGGRVNPGDYQYGVHNKQFGATIGNVMDWFKTMTTNEYIRGVKNNNWMRFDGKLWQRNYYDHIIRNNHAYHNISEYIVNNPAKWNDDTFNCK